MSCFQKPLKSDYRAFLEGRFWGFNSKKEIYFGNDGENDKEILDLEDHDR